MTLSDAKCVDYQEIIVCLRGLLTASGPNRVWCTNFIYWNGAVKRFCLHVSLQRRLRSRGDGAVNGTLRFNDPTFTVNSNIE